MIKSWCTSTSSLALAVTLAPGQINLLILVMARDKQIGRKVDKNAAGRRAGSPCSGCRLTTAAQADGRKGRENFWFCRKCVISSVAESVVQIVTCSKCRKWKINVYGKCSTLWTTVAVVEFGKCSGKYHREVSSGVPPRVGTPFSPSTVHHDSGLP